jgi:hypothetical protein
MIKGDYLDSGFNKFVSTKATPEQHWDNLGEHITFYSTKQYFFVPGEGLTNTTESTVLSEAVTHLGQTTTLHALLASKKIFAFIQQSQAGGCKIICQHDNPTIIRSKGKSDKQHPCARFSANIIGVDKDQSEQLDWNTKTSNQSRPTNWAQRQT